MCDNHCYMLLAVVNHNKLYSVGEGSRSHCSLQHVCVWNQVIMRCFLPDCDAFAALRASVPIGAVLTYRCLILSRAV